jgi:pimeloyl-ACP methyl ester carboxylesterase
MRSHFLDEMNMANSDNVSIVLVHGAWADASNWDAVLPVLFDQGLTALAVQNPLTSLADDVAATHRAIDRMPGKVLLVGHSWGGAVITAAGTHDKVVGMIYVSAFAPDEGESLNNILAGGEDAPPPSAFAGIELDAHGFLWLSPEKLAGDFAQDLPAAKLQIMTASQGPIAMSCFADRMSVPAWRSKPSWYLLAEQDHLIPPAAALAMAQRAGATLTRVSSSHVPMISQPAAVSSIILAAARSVTAS